MQTMGSITGWSDQLSAPRTDLSGSARTKPAPANHRRPGSASARIPVISPILLRWFSSYARRYVARHFHSLRLLQHPNVGAFNGRPLVVFLNHASWWDPLICLLLAERCYPGRPVYAPIDSAQLERYRFFRKLGFFGVEPDTRRGAATFLRMGEQILSNDQAMLWVTPQGRFADPRERPLAFRSGLGHLAPRVPGTLFVPLALEYAYWHERTPEALACFGDPIRVDMENLHWSAETWTRTLESHLAAAQDRLAAASTVRASNDFKVLQGGAAGVGGIYDRWRQWRARWRGEAFQQKHGAL